jgi:erythromycin esterase-like protein
MTSTGRRSGALFDHSATIAEVRELAAPLNNERDLDLLLERIGDARYVLIGEASHGTSEFYRWRADLTRRLIGERGFSFVGVEGDWPDCYRVDRWVKGREAHEDSAREVLGRFERWPTWMWANEEVAEFCTWLREHNEQSGANVGFYGLDVYSLWESMREVIAYVALHEPDALESAYRALECFEPYEGDPQQYAWATRMVPESCEDEVVELLSQLRKVGPADGADDEEARFVGLLNAQIVADAERYYRTMVRADADSWNIRDTHMVDTLDQLVHFHGPTAKAVVWAHNTHVGDARATSMAARGMVNIGQLVRERHGTDGVVLIGFGSYDGSVVAAEYWGAPTRIMAVPPARPQSHEAVVHDAVEGDRLFVFSVAYRPGWFRLPLGHRAIGVVYDPTRERMGNYEPTLIGNRYDAFLHVDHTEALHPLHVVVPVSAAEPETFPWGR